MLTKVLITLAVIFICMMLISNRSDSDLREVPNPAAEKRKKRLRIATYLFMLTMMVAATILIYLELSARGAA